MTETSTRDALCDWEAVRLKKVKLEVQEVKLLKKKKGKKEEMRVPRKWEKQVFSFDSKGWERKGLMMNDAVLVASLSPSLRTWIKLSSIMSWVEERMNGREGWMRGGSLYFKRKQEPRPTPAADSCDDGSCDGHMNNQGKNRGKESRERIKRKKEKWTAFDAFSCHQLLLM